MSKRPVILYVPGLKPKPKADQHKQQLLRCLREGVRRIDDTLSAEALSDDTFQLVSWTYDFYREHRDMNLDIADIEDVLKKTGPSTEDVAIVTSWRRRLTRSLFRAADYLPFLIPHFANEELEIHLRDFNKYLRNKEGVAEAARHKVREALDAATAQGRPILLLGHSMGSVIAYEALWQLSHEHQSNVSVDLLLTSGSPLGQSLVQRHLMGSRATGTDRYPSNIRRWINIAAVGELTAIDMQLQNDFDEMLELKLLAEIDDRAAYNFYHMHGTLNVHAEYGYLINEVTARAVSEWWRGVS